MGDDEIWVTMKSSYGEDCMQQWTNCQGQWEPAPVWPFVWGRPYSPLPPFSLCAWTSSSIAIQLSGIHNSFYFDLFFCWIRFDPFVNLFCFQYSSPCFWILMAIGLCFWVCGWWYSFCLFSLYFQFIVKDQLTNALLIERAIIVMFIRWMYWIY